MCPGCGSKDFHRSRKRWFDLPALLLHAMPYRCSVCFRRFYNWPWLRPAEDPERKKPGVDAGVD